MYLFNLKFIIRINISSMIPFIKFELISLVLGLVATASFDQKLRIVIITKIKNI